MPFKPPALLRNLWSAFSAVSRRSEPHPVSLNVVGSIMLSPKDRLWVVEVGESWVVVGSGTNGLTSLAQMQKGGIPLNQGAAQMPFDMAALQASGVLAVRNNDATSAEHVESAPTPSLPVTAPLESPVTVQDQVDIQKPVHRTPEAQALVHVDVSSELSVSAEIPEEFPMGQGDAGEPGTPENVVAAAGDFPDPAAVAALAVLDEEAVAHQDLKVDHAPAVGDDKMLLEIPEELLIGVHASVVPSEPHEGAQMTGESVVDGGGHKLVEEAVSIELKRVQGDDFKGHAGDQLIVVKSDAIDGDGIPDDAFDAPVGAFNTMQEEVARFAGEMRELEAIQAASETAQVVVPVAEPDAVAAVEIDVDGFPDPVAAADIEMVASARQLAAEIDQAEFESLFHPLSDAPAEMPDLAEGGTPLSFVQIYERVKTNVRH